MEIKYSFTDYNDILQTHLRLLRHVIKFEALEKLGGQSFCFFLFLALAVGGLPGPGPKLN